MKKSLLALAVLSLLVGCSRLPTNAHFSYDMLAPSQEFASLRLGAVARYESWLKAQGFSSRVSTAASSATEQGTATETSILYSGQLSELGDVEVTIEKCNRTRADGSIAPDHSRINIEWRASFTKTPQVEKVWQRLRAEVKTLVSEGIYKG